MPEKERQRGDGAERAPGSISPGPSAMLWHGSSGLRSSLALLLRPRMTKGERVGPRSANAIANVDRIAGWCFHKPLFPFAIRIFFVRFYPRLLRLPYPWRQSLLRERLSR